MRKKENNPGCGCIFSILFYIILYGYFEIKSHKLYDWYSGIGHGFFNNTQFDNTYNI